MPTTNEILAQRSRHASSALACRELSQGYVGLARRSPESCLRCASRVVLCAAFICARHDLFAVDAEALRNFADGHRATVRLHDLRVDRISSRLQALELAVALRAKLAGC